MAVTPPFCYALRRIVASLNNRARVRVSNQTGLLLFYWRSKAAWFLKQQLWVTLAHRRRKKQTLCCSANIRTAPASSFLCCWLRTAPFCWRGVPELDDIVPPEQSKGCRQQRYSITSIPALLLLPARWWFPSPFPRNKRG